MCFFNKTNEGGAVQRDYSEVNFTSVGLLFITLMELQVALHKTFTLIIAIMSLTGLLILTFCLLHLYFGSNCFVQSRER